MGGYIVIMYFTGRHWLLQSSPWWLVRVLATVFIIVSFLHYIFTMDILSVLYIN